MSIRSSEGEPGGRADLGGNARADEFPGSGRHDGSAFDPEMDRRHAGGGVASLLLKPVKTDDTFAFPSLESPLGPPAPTLAQSSPFLAVDTIFYARPPHTPTAGLGGDAWPGWTFRHWVDDDAELGPDRVRPGASLTSAAGERPKYSSASYALCARQRSWILSTVDSPPTACGVK